jgi:hypothetical protein
MSKVSRTNQVLFFSRLSLEKADASTDAQLKRQHEEGALFHIYSGVSSFCAELVSQYGLNSFKDLDELFDRPSLPSELYELSLLYGDPQSWLGSIVWQYQRLLQGGFESAGAASGIIFSQSDYVALFRNWLIELEKTIQRMREHYQEC